MKPRRLRCENEECETRESGQTLLTINVIVDEERVLAESLAQVAPEHFECVVCGAGAEAVQ